MVCGVCMGGGGGGGREGREGCVCVGGWVGVWVGGWVVQMIHGNLIKRATEQLQG